MARKRDKTSPEELLKLVESGQKKFLRLMRHELFILWVKVLSANMPTEQAQFIS